MFGEDRARRLRARASSTQLCRSGSRPAGLPLRRFGKPLTESSRSTRYHSKSLRWVLSSDDAQLRELEALEALRRRERFETWVLLLGGPTAALVGGLAAVLLLVAVTPSGHLLGAAFLLMTTVGFARALLGDRVPTWMSVVGVVGGAGGLGLAVTLAPAGDGDWEQGFASYWPEGRGLWRYGLPNITPEVDQAMLATWTVPLLDAHLDLDEAATFREAIREVYAELESDPHYALAGSVQGIAYSSLILGGTPRQHRFVDLPPDAPARGVPAAVFLHGFGGNLKGYSWVLREVLHDRGYALVAPSYGSGAWYTADALGVLDDTLDWMAGTGRFDMDRIVLLGLSNGGFGVTLGYLAHPERWRGIAWVSGVIDADRMQQLGHLLQHSGQPPALILHGARDDRVPLSYIESGIRALRSAGGDPVVEILPEGDHFLMFQDRPALKAALARWIDRVDARPL